MQRRLVLTYTSLTAVLLLALGVPLALSFAMNNYHHLAIARINDTARLAVQAVPVLRHETPSASFQAVLRDYNLRTGASVVLVDREGRLIAATGADQALTNPRWHERLDQAATGVRSDGSDYPYNVHAEPLFIAEPVESGTTVLGALATISPTTKLRNKAIADGTVLSVLMLGGVSVGLVMSIALAQWIMRPVRVLDRAATAISAGAYDVRAAQDTGPDELRRMARAFNIMADRLTSLLHAQQTFVADAAHQLRNPLTALRLQVESLEPFVVERGRPVLAASVNEAMRLGAILEALLSLAGAQVRRGTPTVIELRAVAAQRVAAWRAVAVQRDVELDLSGPEVRVQCLPDILDQVMDVLLDNAIGVAPPDSTVRVWTVAGRTAAELHVADQGPGMTAEDKARACDRFWRGRGAEDRDGTGLGLAIASTLLDNAGGSLSFDDVRPRGLDVVVRLPVEDAPRRGQTADQATASTI